MERGLRARTPERMGRRLKQTWANWEILMKRKRLLAVLITLGLAVYATRRRADERARVHEQEAPMSGEDRGESVVAPESSGLASHRGPAAP